MCLHCLLLEGKLGKQVAWVGRRETNIVFRDSLNYSQSEIRSWSYGIFHFHVACWDGGARAKPDDSGLNPTIHNKCLPLTRQHWLLVFFPLFLRRQFLKMRGKPRGT